MEKVEAVLARLAGKRVYIDANFFIYFLDQNPTYFDVVVRLFQAASERQFFVVTGKAVIAEVMVYPYQLGDPEKIARFKRFFALDFIQVVDHASDLFDTAALYAGTRRLDLIDALHFATAIHAGCDVMLSNDSALTRQTDLEVIGMVDFL